MCPPWQVLYANPSTFKHHPGGFRYLFLALRSELPRDAGGGGVAGDQAARAARNEDRRTVRHGPIGPCRSGFHHKFACLGTVMCSLCPLGMSPEAHVAEVHAGTHLGTFFVKIKAQPRDAPKHI